MYAQNWVRSISFRMSNRHLCGSTSCLTKMDHFESVCKCSEVHVYTELLFEMILQRKPDVWSKIDLWDLLFKTCVNNFSWAVWRFLLRVRRNLRFDASSLIPYLNLHRFITLHPINMVNIFIRFIFEPFESQTPWDYHSKDDNVWYFKNSKI